MNQNQKEKNIVPTPRPRARINGRDLILYIIIGVLCMLLVAVAHEAERHSQRLHDYYQGEMTRLGCYPKQPITLGEPLPLPEEVTWKP